LILQEEVNMRLSAIAVVLLLTILCTTNAPAQNQKYSDDFDVTSRSLVFDPDATKVTIPASGSQPTVSNDGDILGVKVRFHWIVVATVSLGQNQTLQFLRFDRLEVLGGTGTVPKNIAPKLPASRVYFEFANERKNRPVAPGGRIDHDCKLYAHESDLWKLLKAEKKVSVQFYVNRPESLQWDKASNHWLGEVYGFEF
jgi:hypothetical protein